MACARRIRPLLFPLALLLAGCSQPPRQPVIMLENAAEAPLELRVLALKLGERVDWLTRDGVAGQGYFLALAGDSVVVATRRGDEQHPPEGVQRLALADLEELRHKDRQAEPYISAIIGLPLLGFACLLLFVTVTYSLK